MHDFGWLVFISRIICLYSHTGVKFGKPYTYQKSVCATWKIVKGAENAVFQALTLLHCTEEHLYSQFRLVQQVVTELIW
jgi:hypothetical protein